jgi:hypothetical protein
MEPQDRSRRTFVKKATYVAPVILTLAATPEYAKAGSVKPGGSSPGGSPRGKGAGKGSGKGSGKGLGKG